MVLLSLSQAVFAASAGDLVCPADRNQKPSGTTRDKVYSDTTFKAGEISEYSLYYGVALVGTASFQVMSPYKYKGPYNESLWHRRVRIEAKTGDWYKYILVGRALIDSWIRPWDGGGSRYYMELDYGAMFGAQTSQKKWFDFYSEKCRVNQKVEEGGKSKDEEFDLSYGARDIVSATYWLRELNYTIGKVERTMVFTSGKNWWLNVTPLLEEKVKTEKMGEIEATKLKVQTFIGEKLEQKGDMFVWIEKKDPRRMVKADGEVKIGHVKIDLISYKNN